MAKEQGTDPTTDFAFRRPYTVLRITYTHKKHKGKKRRTAVKTAELVSDDIVRCLRYMAALEVAFDLVGSDGTLLARKRLQSQSATRLCLAEKADEEERKRADEEKEEQDTTAQAAD